MNAPYHHGDLPAALLQATADAIVERGPAGVSLREVARRAGVSHAAPAHHFGDKSGLFTALATQGFDRFADALRDARDTTAGDMEPGEQFREIGRAYVRFAIANRGHFEVMFRNDLCTIDDPSLGSSRDEAFSILADMVTLVQEAGVESGRAPEDVMLTAWAGVHGLSWLILQDALGPLAEDREVDHLVDIITAGLID